MAEKYLIRDTDGDGESEYELERENGAIRVRRVGSDAWKDVELKQIGESPLYLLMVDSHPMELFLQRRRGGAHATIGRHAFDYDVERWPQRSANATSRKEAGGPRRITAPMTGSIIFAKLSILFFRTNKIYLNIGVSINGYIQGS